MLQKNNAQVEPNFLVDVRALATFDPSHNYGDPEADQWFAWTADDVLEWTAGHEFDDHEVDAFDRNGAAVGFVRFKVDGSTRATRPGLYLASEVAQHLLRGDVWEAEMDASHRGLTVVVGAQPWRDLTDRADNRHVAILGLSAWNREARALVREKLPPGWVLTFFGVAACKAVLS